MRIRHAEPKDSLEICAVVRRSITELCVVDHRGLDEILSPWLANKTPKNVVRWITAPSQLAPIVIGALLTVVKIHGGLARASFSGPGPYKRPPGTVAYEVDAPEKDAPRQVNDTPKSTATDPQPMNGMNMRGMRRM